MAVYAIGDVQGCYDDLQRLLERIRFDPAADRLWFAGDLVNRGPKSLQVLHFVMGLGRAAVSVLGNHDLHLLAVSEGNLKHFRNDTVDEILQAPDREQLLDWLRHLPLLHRDPKIGFSLLHAGLPPQWDLNTAAARAREVEAALQGPGYHDYCQQMYGNHPARWEEGLQGMRRLRYITNCFSRLRYCSAEGRLRLEDSGPPGSQQAGFLPWFAVPGRASAGERIAFGHWSTLGYYQGHNVWALDSGCLWGGRLTALRLGPEPQPIQEPCPQAREPRSG